MTDVSADVETAVKNRFSALARDPARERRFPVGPGSAKRLGYSAAEVDSLPNAATESFAGVGNPFALGKLRPGQTVLDLGCPAGMDSILAGRRVGATGKVIGVDMVQEMLDKARRNAAAGGVSNADFRPGRADAIPLPSDAADMVVTNGVFNLCVDKPKVIAELFRVLRPGGRLQMADLLLEPHVTPEELAGKGTWSDGVSGAIRERSLREMLVAAGFVDVAFHGWTGYRTSGCTQGALVSSPKPGGWITC